MIYGINDRIPAGKALLFGCQLFLATITATLLIANICGAPVSGALFGAGMATIVYLLATNGNSPMFISNSGNYVSPVLLALSLGGFSAVFVGGITACVVYCIFGVIFMKIPVENIYKVFPKSLIGAVTVVIGVSLMGFIGTYCQINGATNIYGVIIALVTAFIIALISHYAKGMVKILPFLLGTIAGYIISVVLTVTGVCKLVDFSVFEGMSLFCRPDMAFAHFHSIDIKVVLSVVLVFAAYTVSAMMECMADHMALGNIIGVDLYKTPGLGRIFIGEGLANIISTFYGGLAVCSYGEGVSCVGFSKVASPVVTSVAAVMMIMLSFFEPIQVFVASIPSCVFGGCAIILYAFIAASGVKTLQHVDLDNQKNLLIVASTLSIGISGVALGGATFALSGTALALVVGVILNIVLKEKEEVNG